MNLKRIYLVKILSNMNLKGISLVTINNFKATEVCVPAGPGSRGLTLANGGCPFVLRLRFLLSSEAARLLSRPRRLGPGPPTFSTSYSELLLQFCSSYPLLFLCCWPMAE